MPGIFHTNPNFSEEDIERLKQKCEIIVDESMTDLEGQECPICLMKFDNGARMIKFNKCIHSFHTECITHWLKVNATCPMCKSDKKCELEDTVEGSFPDQSNDRPLEVETEMATYHSQNETRIDSFDDSQFEESNKNSKDQDEEINFLELETNPTLFKLLGDRNRTENNDN